MERIGIGIRGRRRTGALLAAALLAATPVASATDARAQTSSERRAVNQLGRSWRSAFSGIRKGYRLLRRDALPQVPAEQAEAYRYLAGLAIYGLERSLFFDDPDFPRFQPTPSPITRWGQENPDNRYLSAPIRGDATYRITGRPGSAHHLVIQVVEGDVFRGGGTVVSSLTSFDLVTEADGSFDILASPAPPPGPNTLTLTPGSTRISIREIFYDWANEEPGRFRIVRVGSEGLAPPAPTAESVAAALEEAGALAVAQAEHWADFADNLRAALPPNLLLPPQGAVGAPDATLFGGGHFELQPGQALLIVGAVPDAHYWGYSLGSLSFATLDYANHQTSVNGAQAYIDSDGLFRAVISVEDPGVPNWLDPVGHREGWVVYRYTAANNAPVPVARVVPLADLPSLLPPDHPVVTPAQRRATIAVRQEHVSRRFGY